MGEDFRGVSGGVASVVAKELLAELEQHSADLPGLECDGFCRVAGFLLGHAGIEYQVYVGRVLVTEVVDGDVAGSGLLLADGITHHYWLRLPSPPQGKSEQDPLLLDPLLLDYRARKWLSPQVPEAEIPHGIFRPSEYPRFLYQGQPLALPQGWAGKGIYRLLCAISGPVDWRALADPQ